MVLAVLYRGAAVIGLLFIVLGLVGGKYIVLEVVGMLQVTYMSLLQIDRYTPLYLAMNRLSWICGEFSTDKRQHHQYSQLNTLKLSDSFVSNINVQLILFVFFFICGGILLIVQRRIKSNKAFWLSIVG